MKTLLNIFSFAILFCGSQAIIAQSGIINYSKAMALHNLGYEKMADGNYTEALNLYNQAIAIDTTHAHYFENRGHAKKYLKDWNGALADYTKANQIEPNATYETYFQAGEILQKQLKNLDKAILMYNKALEVQLLNEVDDLRYLIYFNRGNTLLKLNDYQSAVTDYTSALEIFPEHGNSHINRGFTYYNLGKKEFACADWQIALGLGVFAAEEYIEEYCK